MGDRKYNSFGGPDAKKAHDLKMKRIRLGLSVGIPVAIGLVLCGCILASGALGKKIAKAPAASGDAVEDIADSVESDVEEGYPDTIFGDRHDANTAGQVLSTDAGMAIQLGDTIHIDYVGTIDGKEFEGGSTEGLGADLAVGSGAYVDGFEDQLVGYHPGDEVSLRVTFPEDYSVEEVRGKEVLFTVQVHGIYQAQVDAMSDPMADPMAGGGLVNGPVMEEMLEPDAGLAE